jgi:hypothetical protein
MLDLLIGNSLALRLHDEQFAHEVYTDIEAPPDAGSEDTVRVDIDGWIFPRPDVAFVWTLQEDADHPQGGTRPSRPTRT